MDDYQAEAAAASHRRGGRGWRAIHEGYFGEVAMKCQWIGHKERGRYQRCPAEATCRITNLKIRSRNSNENLGSAYCPQHGEDRARDFLYELVHGEFSIVPVAGE